MLTVKIPYSDVIDCNLGNETLVFANPNPVTHSEGTGKHENEPCKNRAQSLLGRKPKHDTQDTGTQ
ncbi:hypothetical protein SAMN05216388_10485 [Halorientalis persicus]|uniref:Uncharacterized protein n=1 Tax=Halorientalis persicus TaxID=1367881 RepID=A0A1H8W4S3_9EURY|nr:hypothetical protein SAMN05216388_10485 [Halorientalis persicus]